MSNLLFDQIHKKFSALSVASIISTSALVVTPVSAQAETVKIFTATTFNFKGCTKSSNGLDIICVGSFRNRDADQNIRISRTGNYGNTFITDTNGESSVADEIQIGSRSCRSKCGSELVTLVEGAEYKISFIFKDVTLPSSKIALFQISYYYGGSYNMKFRKVSVSGNKVSTGNYSGLSFNNFLLVVNESNVYFG
jgi:predicted metal-binding protein